jgi:hypothetical protein
MIKRKKKREKNEGEEKKSSNEGNQTRKKKLRVWGALPIQTHLIVELVPCGSLKNKNKPER